MGVVDWSKRMLEVTNLGDLGTNGEEVVVILVWLQGFESYTVTVFLLVRVILLIIVENDLELVILLATPTCSGRCTVCGSLVSTSVLWGDLGVRLKVLLPLIILPTLLR